MPANFDNLARGPENGIFRNATWYYDTTDDAATMNTSGYFSGGVARGMQVGDQIIARTWTSAVPAGGHPATSDALTAVTSFWVVSADLDADVVDVSNGDAQTLTDSD